jgi:hypothetical protein
MLTIPKIKDLVNAPTQKYENMYNIINTQKTHISPNLEKEYSLSELLPKKEEINMKSELKNFLKTQLHPKTNENEMNISSLDLNHNNSYSNY